MSSVKLSIEEMLQRVARFEELRPNAQAFVDSLLPGHLRENLRILGKGVSDDPSHRPAIAEPHDFNVGVVKAPPGNGAGLHSHPTVEVFFALSGRWLVYWGDNGENEITLGPWDTISVPQDVMRGFRNIGNEDAYLMTIIGGSDPGRVTWPSDVLERAREATGAYLDEQGNLARSS